MTRKERIKKLRCLITCMKCEVSGKVCDDNCPTQYNAGNMGEIIENLEEIAKELEQEPTTKNCESCEYYGSHHEVCNYCYKCSLWTEQEPTTKNDCAEQNGCLSCSLEDGDDCCRKLYEESIQEPTTKNDIPHCQHTDEEIAKSFIEDVEAVKDQLPTTKNDLGVDCISRAEAIKCLECDFDITGKENMKTVVNYINSAHDKIVNLPSVTPQEPQSFKWCTDCKEYDQEKHCCHRWSKVIRDTVEEMEQEQEPITKILEDIKGEIFEQYWGDSRKEYFDDNDSKEYIDGALEAADYIIKMIDKHNRK